MRPFHYHAPETINEAVSLLTAAPRETRVMAGGTDLLVQMRRGTRSPTHVVDLKRIEALHEISFHEDTGLTFGAAVTCARLCETPEIAAHYPGLIDAFSLIGGIATQGRATIGGNVGNAAPSADSIPPLIVHGATCTAVGPGGKRTIALDKFCTGPGTNALSPDEILVSFHVPPPPPDSAGAYLRFIPRGEMDIAVAGSAVWIESEEGLITTLRVALTAVAPTPLPVEEVQSLRGKPLTLATFEQAGEIAAAAARPITDHRGTAEQRRHLVRVLTVRALETALARLEGGATPSASS